MLAVGSWMEVSSCSIEEELRQAVDDLRNNSADGYFNIPEADLCEWNSLSLCVKLCSYIHVYLHLMSIDDYQFFPLCTANETAFNYYNVVSSSEGNDSVELSLRYVSAMGCGKPHPFGYCELHGPALAVHYVPEYLFWPPILKTVCSRPCLTYGNRCRPSCCETRCHYRFVWRCYLYSYYCSPYGWQEVCYEQHNACKCTCAYNDPYCYFWAAKGSRDIELNLGI